MVLSDSSDEDEPKVVAKKMAKKAAHGLSDDDQDFKVEVSYSDCIFFTFLGTGTNLPRCVLFLINCRPRLRLTNKEKIQLICAFHVGKKYFRYGFAYGTLTIVSLESLYGAGTYLWRW